VSEAVRFAVEYPYPQDKAAFRKQVEAIAGFDCSPRLAAISSQALIIHGIEDLLFPPEQSAKALQTIPKASTCRIENAAHSIHLENPEGFTQAVLDFLLR
jgi:pimeloyl-ACP methyl ester carboxylesterase